MSGAVCKTATGRIRTDARLHALAADSASPSKRLRAGSTPAGGANCRVLLVAQEAEFSSRQRGFDSPTRRHGLADGRYRVYETREAGSIPAGAASALARGSGGAPPKRARDGSTPSGSAAGTERRPSRRAHNPLPLAKLVRLQPLQRRRRSERARSHTARPERSTRSVGTDPRWCSGSMPVFEAVRAWFESTTGNICRARLLVRASALQAGAAGFDPLARYYARG